MGYVNYYFVCVCVTHNLRDRIVITLETSMQIIHLKRLKFTCHVMNMKPCLPKFKVNFKGLVVARLCIDACIMTEPESERDRWKLRHKNTAAVRQHYSK